MNTLYQYRRTSKWQKIKFVVHGSQVQKWTDDIQRLKQERDAYKKQRDELINDMAETESKSKGV